MPFRLLAWVIAIALGGVITVAVARKTGWLSGQRLVDVFTGTGTGRYLRVIAIVPVWAIVSTLLVTLLVEGGRWLLRVRWEAQSHRSLARANAAPSVDNGAAVDGTPRDADSMHSSARTPAGRGGR